MLGYEWEDSGIFIYTQQAVLTGLVPVKKRGIESPKKRSMQWEIYTLHTVYIYIYMIIHAQSLPYI